MKVGDLVICRPKNTAVWYWGKPGLLIHFDLWGTPDQYRGDPVVKYGSRTVRLAREGLRVLHEAR